MAAGIYGYGAWSFRQASVYRLFDTWDEAYRNGDPKPMCDAMTSEMTFSTLDRVGGQVHERKGNREEFCAVLDKVMPVMAKKMTSYAVTREHFTATRQGIHWLSTIVSFTEHEDIVFTDGMHVRQDNEVHLTMEKTLGGLRVTHLDVDSRVLPPS